MKSTIKKSRSNDFCNCDYLSLEELHAEQLRLLVWFDNFCKQNELRYSLDSGTLLGAIRHKGFIPWDDDIDVSMPRPDYNRLLAMRNNLPKGMTIIDASNSNFVYSWSKLFDKSIHAQEPGYAGVMDEYLWLDIFPFDGISSDIEVYKRLQNQVKHAHRKCVHAYCSFKFTDSPKDALRCIYSVFVRLVGNSRKQLLRVVEQVMTNPGYCASKYVAPVLSPDVNPPVLLREETERFVDVEFEGHTFKAVSCWDEYLTKMYGNYMELPPKKQRVTHGVKAWRVVGGV